PVLLAATTGGIYRSADAGASWILSKEGFGTDLRLRKVAADPVDGNVAYALTFGQIAKTEDGGITWRRLTNGLPAFPQTYALAVSPTEPQVVLLSVRGDIYRSADRGETFTLVYTGMSNHYIQSFAFSATGTVYAASWGGGVLKSADAGATWSTALAGVAVAVVAADPSGDSVYAGASGMLYRSVDGGSSWDSVSSFYPYSLTIDAAGVLWRTSGAGVEYSLDRGSSWTRRNEGLTTTEVNEIRFFTGNAGPTMFAATNFGGVFKSEDGAATWSKSSSGLIGGIVKDVGASSDGTLWAATYGAGALRSRDGGQSWTTTTSPTEAYGSIAIDPSDPQTVYLGRWGGGTIHKTTDGGTTWSTLQTPSSAAIEAVAVHPLNRATIYAAMQNGGVFKSTDGGATWSNVTPPGETRYLSLIIDASNPDVIYAGSSTGVFRSPDAGAAWSLVVSTFAVDALARDAATGTLYAGSGPYVHVSSDGLTWTRRNAPSHVRALRSSANGLYAATSAGVYASVDDAMTWSQIGSLGNLDPWAVEIDPANSSRFYVASNAGAGLLALNRLELAISGPGSVCAGGSATLDAGPGFATYLWSTGETSRSMGPGFVTYLWSDGGSGRSRFLAPATTTTYTVTATTSAGCSTTGSVTITVNPTPVASITADGPTTFCEGGSVTLTASAGATSYRWYPGGETTQSITVTAGATYWVTVSNGSCSSSASQAVTVNPTPPVPTITAADEGGAVRLTASAASSHLWSPGGETTQSILVTAPGSYTVTVTESGCSATSDAAVVGFAEAGDGVTAGTEEVTATFTSVTTGGSFTAVATTVDEPLPSGYYELEGTGVAWEVSTTAEYTGAITIGFHVAGVDDLAAFQALRVLHGEMVVNPDTGVEELQLVDRTSGWDFENRIVYATVDSLSPFVVARVTTPTVTEVAAPAEAVRVGTPLAFTATFTDPDTASGHAATWEWGDGTTSAGTIVFDAARGVFTVTGSHAYAGAGLYTVRLVVSDGSGEANGAAGPVIVYDPDGGWITGAATLASPAGALRGNASPASARVSLTAKYDKQSGALKGNVEIHVGGSALRLRAEALEWLVVDGAAAVLQGRCSLEGSTECSFRITAIDGGNPAAGPDRARLEIWDGGATALYDNARESDEAPAIESGDLTVHE
ncbi:MAG: hypothetical protein LC732_09250, partial [Acidobacteria bacterium]|nr:hypothetical protein [Acidobacteriota bacterium]